VIYLNCMMMHGLTNLKVRKCLHNKISGVFGLLLHLDIKFMVVSEEKHDDVCT